MSRPVLSKRSERKVIGGRQREERHPSRPTLRSEQHHLPYSSDPQGRASPNRHNYCKDESHPRNRDAHAGRGSFGNPSTISPMMFR